jgi:hypothetical protein
VRWRTKTSTEVVEKSVLPPSLLKAAESVRVLREEEDCLQPAGSGGDADPYRGSGARINDEVNASINRLLASHQVESGVRVLRQSLVVRATPIYEARYRWGATVLGFWVFGRNHEVHAPDFPRSGARIAIAIVAPIAIAAGLLALILFSRG